MTKSRSSIPRATKDSVLKEFNHRCAICGTERPQIHHIDEDPSNNELLNLIPLCPNCHLTDQHNPTIPIDTEKLKLFRQFKDPMILKPQFHPLFIRMQFLNPVDENIKSKDLADLSQELIEFIASLEMGSFYSKRISKLIKRNYATNQKGVMTKIGPASFPVAVETEVQYIERLKNAYPNVVSLAVELLRFQKW